MKKILRLFLTILLSFVAIFYNKEGLNVILTIPLLAFFMFNGLKYFIVSLFSLLIGFLCHYSLNHEYISLTYFLISLAIYFLIYYILLIFNKKLIINYFFSCFISIIISYLIMFFSLKTFNIKLFIIVLFLSCINSFLFAFLIKNFSFHLLSFQDNYSKIIVSSLICLYLSCIPNIFNYYLLSTITLLFIILIACIFALNTNLINVLAFNSSLLILLSTFQQNIDIKSIILILFISTLLCINKSKYNYLNSLLVLSCFIIFYLLSNTTYDLSYFIVASIVAISVLFITHTPKEFDNEIYYRQYLANKNELIVQFVNFQTLFLTLGNSFKKAQQNRILQRTKEEVFNTLCFDCNKMNNCHQKGRHLLLNYIKESLNNTLDDNKIRYIKQNCIKQEAYFKLLDKFTNSYLLNSYQKESQTKIKDIIAADFYNFANIMKKCRDNLDNDRLIISKNFYKNIKETLLDYHFDVIFVNDLTKDGLFQFDIALKDIKKEEIESILLPLINQTLQTKMEIINIDIATLSFSYFIISIKEAKKINISFAIKQSNEDIKANGDSTNYLDTYNDFYLAISDGMGNGLDANEESKFSLDILLSLLKAKMPVKSAILILNDLIQLKNDFESYSTLDLIEIDKQNKIATFYKLGAFDTYIIRNHHVSEVNNFSLPLGIVNDIKILPASYKIQKDDIIVMCSDGMIDDTNNEIISVLEDISIDSPKTICNVLFSHLIDIRQNNDDATLIIICIN